MALLTLLGYFMIGMFVSGLVIEKEYYYDEEFIWVMIFWPILVAGVLLLIALLAPLKLAQGIRSKLEEK